MAGFLATQQDPEQMRPAPGTESARQPAKDGPVEEPRTASTDRDKGSQGATPNKGSIRTAREKSGFPMLESRNCFPVIPSPSSSRTAERANPALSASSSDERIKASIMAARDNGGFLTQQPSYSPRRPAPAGQSADSPQTRGPIRAARQRAGLPVEPVQAQRPLDSSTQLRSPPPAQLQSPPPRSNLRPSPQVAGDQSLPKDSMRAAREKAGYPAGPPRAAQPQTSSTQMLSPPTAVTGEQNMPRGGLRAAREWANAPQALDATQQELSPYSPDAVYSPDSRPPPP
ncbi:hypothetical protein LTS18_012698, partial [Coniosporium uncinatum]